MFQVLPTEAERYKENFQFNNIFDNRAAQADLNFQYTIPWVEGARRIVAWLDARGSINDNDEPAFYAQLLVAWQHAGARMADKLVSQCR